MGDYHEPAEFIDKKHRDYVRALNSLKEEVEAVDWYNQRVAASDNEELKAIMAHNRDEEIEHAAMTLEWLRRHMDGWDEQLRTYLFTNGPITEIEEGEEEEDGSGDGATIGDMK
ncbi:encapsulin-associated ferritin-like protein [Dethiothermospora halolimnae]|uniref:encapsulin-associated ferritin-like protein n=1 Tax=Dethiothermospora halolimnae TaxID=3114390 RepID=UPI003CCC2B49